MTQSISHSGWNKLEWLCFCGIPSTPSNETMLASVSPLYPQSLEVFLASPSSKSCCLLPASVWQLQREAACCLLLVTSKGEETMVWARCLLQEATCCLLTVMSRGEETMGWAWCLLQEATCCHATCHVKRRRNNGLGLMSATRGYLLSATSHVKRR